jgi:hypothetical protein
LLAIDVVAPLLGSPGPDIYNRPQLARFTPRDGFGRAAGEARIGQPDSPM